MEGASWISLYGAMFPLHNKPVLFLHPEIYLLQNASMHFDSKLKTNNKSCNVMSGNSPENIKKSSKETRIIFFSKNEMKENIDI